MSNANVYQVNFHEGDGWQIIDESVIQQRVGSSWDYMVWQFDQGQTASVRGVEYRRVASRPAQVRVEVERRGYSYYYSRYRDGSPDVAGQPISISRARQLIENNPGGNGRPDFGSEVCAWVYTAVVRLEEV